MKLIFSSCSIFLQEVRIESKVKLLRKIRANFRKFVLPFRAENRANTQEEELLTIVRFFCNWQLKQSVIIHVLLILGGAVCEAAVASGRVEFRMRRGRQSCRVGQLHEFTNVVTDSQTWLSRVAEGNFQSAVIYGAQEIAIYLTHGSSSFCTSRNTVQ